MHSLLGHTLDHCLALFNPLVIVASVWPYLLMLLGFSFIVFFHELGHFAVAKWAGVRVERFAVGFGREIIGFTRGETRYSFNILPLGGYVKMLGQEDFDDKAKEMKFNADPRSFVNKPVSHRMAIVSAGVIMNVILACLLFMIVFMVGIKTMSTKIAAVEPDSPAARAGVLPGDIIETINGHRIREFREVFMSVILASIHEPLELVVDRDGTKKSFSIKPQLLHPEFTREAQRLVVGIRPGITREIVGVGPEIDTTKSDRPHVGDVLVEIDGVEINDDNVNRVISMLAYAGGSVFVERKDPKDPSAEPQRVRVEIPPILSLKPDDGRSGTVSVLGLTPLVRFDQVREGRAAMAGLEIGDTILSWDDRIYPNANFIFRSIRDSAERDIHFVVRTRDGQRREGFVRPKRNRKGNATIGADCNALDESEAAEGQPVAELTNVRPSGIAAVAGLEDGDRVLSCMGRTLPTMRQVNEIIRKNPGRTIPMTVRKRTGETLITKIVPQRPGSIDAKYALVADDILRVAEVVETIHGRPSPAAMAGIERGALITHVNGRPVSRWRELIDAFRAEAGTTVALGYRDTSNQAHEAAFPVPNSLRTLLGVGSEARILSIDGKRTVMFKTPRGLERVSVGYRGGLRTILAELDGRQRVPVEYRRNPLASVETGYVDVDAGMLDPWLGRVDFAPNINTAPELTLLKGENVIDAVGIGIHKTYYFMIQVYTTFERMFFSKSVSMDNISGPLGIIDIGGRVARAGFVEFIFFLAIISANLAVINFLPLPIVDGGLMIFLIIEKIKGSPVSMRVQVATQVVGLFLIMSVFLYVTFNDVMRLWG